MRKHRRPARAFTLIELLVVIAIIAILAALLVSPNPDLRSRRLQGPLGCDYQPPSGPNAREFQTRECQAYQ